MRDFARYETPAAAHRQLGLVCTGFGSFSHKTSVCHQRRLASYAAVWVSEGSGWLETEATSQRFSISNGTLFWLFPQVMHSYSPDSVGWEEQWVLFEGPMAEAFEQLGFLSASHPVQQTGFSPTIEAIFAQIYADFSSGGPLASPLGAARVHQLIVASHQLRIESQAQDKLTGQMQQARRWFDEHALEALDFEEVARKHHMGYSTLRRHFKQATGYSPKEYVLRMRLTRAKELLAFTQQTITEIARNVGFSDPYYFSRIFHQKEGIAPTLFRQQQQNGN